MKNVHRQKMTTAILLMVFVAAQAPHLQAQGSAGPPLLLFSTSDIADLAAAPAEVHAQFNHI